MQLERQGRRVIQHGVADAAMLAPVADRRRIEDDVDRTPAMILPGVVQRLPGDDHADLQGNRVAHPWFRSPVVELPIDNI